MATAVAVPPVHIAAGWPLGLGLIALAVAAAGWAGLAPITFSIVTVFLFAGPHNWFETRYFLERLPARAGKLWPFFTVAAVGIVGLTATFAAVPWLVDAAGLDASAVWPTVWALWNTAFIAWVLWLVQMRMQTNPRRDWGWTLPVGFALIAANWLAPLQFGLGMVYAHPLMALWILDRELSRSKPHWRPAYRACLAVIPLLLGLLWWHLAAAPELPDDPLAQTIAGHAGFGTLGLPVSAHFLVAAHTFLEMVHYGVWVVAIPLIGMRTLPWRLDSVPLAKRSPRWRTGVLALLGFGLFVVLTLWVCFGLDYAVTRHVYFTVALMHVLAEVPFLLRAL